MDLFLGEDGVRSLDQLGLPGKAWRTWTHHTMTPTDEQLDDAFETVSSFTSQPCFPLSAAYTLILAEMAAAKGVRVILSGEGADELFGGYESYMHFFRTHAQSHVENFYLDGTAVRWAMHLLGKPLFEAMNLIKSRLHRHAQRAEDPLRRLLNYEVPLSLSPLLERVDHTSMQYSLEVRLPFLHGEIPAIAVALGENQRTKLTTTKPVLRQALHSLNGAPPYLASIPTAVC
jgi:asparagine synthase (glutamine-hydrolysing)